jgi:hypothetical protein
VAEPLFAAVAPGDFLFAFQRRSLSFSDIAEIHAGTRIGAVDSRTNGVIHRARRLAPSIAAAIAHENVARVPHHASSSAARCASKRCVRHEPGARCSTISRASGDRTNIP